MYNRKVINNNTSHYKLLHAFLPIEQDIVSELLNDKIIDNQQLEIVVNEYKKKVHDILSILLSLGFIKHKFASEIVKKKYEVEEVNLNNCAHNMNLLKMVHKNTMIVDNFVPFDIINDIVYVAAANPKHSKTIDSIRISFANKYKVKLFYAPSGDIKHFISSAYILAEKRLESAVETLQRNALNAEDKSSFLKLEENCIVNFVNALLEDAVLKNASDIHVEPQMTFIRVRYRIDGKLLNMVHIYKHLWNSIVIRLKVISGMNIAESRFPQDGRIEMTITGRVVDFRISCQPGIYGEKFVIRVLDKSKSLVTLEQLGFSKYNFDRIQTTISRPSGVTIVTGPTGSGKTTTLYSILSYLNNIDTNIMTLEDPIEYIIPLIFQTQVSDKQNFGFAEGIRSAMRQDPDILLIGEIRDNSTAEVAMRASLTGHKVLTTLHTIDAVTTIQRLIDIGVNRYILSGNIDTIISQRLVRKLCNVCKKPHTDLSPLEIKILDKYHNLIHSKSTIYEPVGCEVCNFTGYKGRTTIAEILHTTPEIDDAILNVATKHTIIDLARKEGFKTIQEDAIEQILLGIISFDEVLHTISLM